MIHALVRRKIRAVFACLSAGDATPVLASLAPRFTCYFHGDHALGGVRTRHHTILAWWERLFRLLPGARFAVEDILVNGPPWHVRVALTARVVGILPDGQRYENRLMQHIHLRWGRITRVETLEDLQHLQRALDDVAAAGNAEALAPPLQDVESTLP